VERIPDCTGVLVAGGQSMRLGRLAKGLARIGGEAIAARSLRLFRELFGAVLVVGDPAGPYAGLGAEVVPDAIPGKGAPGGIHAALGAARTGWIFAAGCDMPFLSADAIRFLWDRRGAAPAALVRWGRGLEGLHAFWSRACLPRVDLLLRRGDPSVAELAAAAGARVVEAEEWKLVDPRGRSLENANTPEDLARLGLEPPAQR
jgi:molybdopterin-guanine dinucleotide biosynthesis protein A